MKVKLIKVDKGYYNLEDEKGNILGTSYQFNSSVGDVLEYKLSKQNCDEIFGVADVEKLAEDFAKNHSIYPTAQDDTEYGFKQGFNKAMELNKEKVFTTKDMENAFLKGVSLQIDFPTFQQSLQQPTEIEVEIEMEYIGECKGNDNNGCFQDSPGHNCGCFEYKPKLDSEGCLIFKKI